MDAAFARGALRPGGLRAWLWVFGAHVRKELVVMMRYPLEFAGSFAQTFLMVAVFTLAALLFAPPGGAGGGSAVVSGVMSYGFVIFIFFTETLWTLGCSIRREQRQGTLEHLYVSPASRGAVLVSRAAVVLLWTGLLCVMSVALMGALVGELPVRNLLFGSVVLAFALSGIFGVGFAFAGLVLRAGETSQTLATVFQFAFMVACAPFFPFGVLPEWMLAVARLIPVAHGVDLFRSALMGFPPGFPELAPPAVGTGVVVVSGLFLPALGFWFYRRSEEWARRRGSLSDY